MAIHLIQTIVESFEEDFFRFIIEKDKVFFLFYRGFVCFYNKNSV